MAGPWNWSPIRDEGGKGGKQGKQDDCEEIRDQALDQAVGGAKYAYCTESFNQVHAQWKRNYRDLPNFHFPNILEQ